MASFDESPTRIEPCLLDEAGTELLDLVAGLSSASAALGARLHPRAAASLADAMRIMNCYYSNLIEGHHTPPREIEAALAGRLDDSEERRNLQLEARAHIRLQREIDRRHAAGDAPEPGSMAFIRWLHAEFYRDAPSAMLTVRSNDRELRMKPGDFRARAEEEVSVGRHLPPSPGYVSSFMAHFEARFRFARLGSGSRIMAIAAAHHRFNYIHPFLLARPGIVVAMILSIIFSWNNFVFGAVLGSRSTRTLPAAVYTMLSFEQIAWGPLAAAALLVTAPVLVLTLFIQKEIVGGLTAGGVKGG